MISLTLLWPRVRSHIQIFWRAYAGIAAILIVSALAVTTCNRLLRDDGAVNEIKAERAEDKALNHEGRADAARDQADAIEPQRVEAARRVNEAKRQVAAGRARLEQKRKEYDEAQTGNAVIDRSGTLSDREQRILAKLDRLYPDFIRPRTANN